ncbi:endonuclease/exonuclease/phosphatase family protein [Sinomicrobium soli]|uniref:endonuclease/exonuclease/phosphatase family protein n=1 Tax=Sinomicrobium sp. N-1-3-6 TaxID=2219864 RepID=UPI000DCE3671|nr:endonuclease/exonuclease/phosphatase family protein [Sinomicrobium sp. N-1-3-6]RAV28421.1 endonuclease [Sinomicrobium sp. N-1-3-6]
MKPIRIVFVFSLVLCSHLQAQERSLKVLSYNLRFGELASLEELAAFIKNEKPDVVALQEVDVRTYRERAPEQNGKDFITELGFRTGMFCAYGKTILYKGGYYGIGILSKYPFASTDRVYLPRTENGKEQRAMLIADIEYEEGKYFTFVSTHLDYTNTRERQLQVQRLNEVLQNRPYPVIVSGDFNARPESEEIRNGMSGWLSLSGTDKKTVPAKDPKYKIDYIFCRPGEQWEKVVDTVYGGIRLSDHLPVSATVRIKP